MQLPCSIRQAYVAKCKQHTNQMNSKDKAFKAFNKYMMNIKFRHGTPRLPVASKKDLKHINPQLNRQGKWLTRS